MIQTIIFLFFLNSWWNLTQAQVHSEIVKSYNPIQQEFFKVYRYNKETKGVKEIVYQKKRYKFLTSKGYFLYGYHWEPFGPQVKKDKVLIVRTDTAHLTPSIIEVFNTAQVEGFEKKWSWVELLMLQGYTFLTLDPLGTGESIEMIKFPDFEKLSNAEKRKWLQGYAFSKWKLSLEELWNLEIIELHEYLQERYQRHKPRFANLILTSQAEVPLFATVPSLQAIWLGLDQSLSLAEAYRWIKRINTRLQEASPDQETFENKVYFSKEIFWSFVKVLNGQRCRTELEK